MASNNGEQVEMTLHPFEEVNEFKKHSNLSQFRSLPILACAVPRAGSKLPFTEQNHSLGGCLVTFWV